MTPIDNESSPATAPPHQAEGLERQKGRPMWGCVKGIFILLAAVVIILSLIGYGVYYYLGTTSFADFVRMRIERNLEAHLGRDVSIRKVILYRSRPARLVLQDLRIANAPGAKHPYFMVIREVEIIGGLESFWRRQIRLGRIDIRDPRMFFEVFPQGFPLEHNFPTWKPSKPARFEITRVDITRMFVTGGLFDFLDRRHEIHAVAGAISSEITPTFREQIYRGFMNSPQVRIRIQDYEPFDVTMSGRFDYHPGALAIEQVALVGQGIKAALSGNVKPLTEAVYSFRIRSTADLTRVRQIFRVEKTLKGTFALDGTLKGEKGQFALEGNVAVPRLVADVYELTDFRGRLRVTDLRTTMHIAGARYGGGTISGEYALAKYAEPYPMSVNLRFNGVSLEKLFGDWTLRDTGLQGDVVGTLAYSWNKDDILNGHGTGNATLRPGAIAFGNAPFPVRVSGSSAFRLDRGTITFGPTDIRTAKSEVAFTGTLRIEDLMSNLKLQIKSGDFAEVDRIALNFARSLNKKDYKLLGLGGNGSATGTVKGKLESPQVEATVTAPAFAFNNIPVGSAEMALHYEGATSVLTFHRAVFREAGGTLTMRGDLKFPERGPSPVFDLVVDAAGFPVEKALKVVDLKIAAKGLGSGRLRVTGTPDVGKVEFDRMVIAQGRSELHLQGLIRWWPGEGNVAFNLDVGATAYPVADVVAFLELGNIPVTGVLTGTLHLEGPKATLEGAGSVVVRNGAIFGEPIDVARADLLFTTGRLRATNIEVRSPAGVITGEAEVELSAEKFSYMLSGTGIDLSRIKALAPYTSTITGRLTFNSSGAGTFSRPEIVAEGRIEQGTLQGAPFPADAPPPTFYFATRNGQLIIRASAFDAFTVEGNGTIDAKGNLAGLVTANIPDLTRFFRIFGNAPETPVEGALQVNLALGGKLTPVEALRIEGTVPVLDLRVSGQQFTAVRPIRFTLQGGRINIETFELARDGSTFSAGGSVSLVGDKKIDLTVRGALDAALLQLVAPDMKAQGQVKIAAGISGTLDNPAMNGTAEIIGGQLKITGFPQLIDDITGTVVFLGNQLRIDSFSATLGSGKVVGGGSIWLKGLALERIGLSLRGTDVSLRYFEGLAATGDFDVRLSGDAQRMQLKGDINVDRALYYKDFELTTALLNLILERKGLVPAVAASWQDHVSLDLHVAAPEGTLSIRNNIATVTGSGELAVTGTLANPIALGLITIDEGGRVRFQDIDYTIVRGTINFQNPYRLDPYFDITAEARVQEYDLTVNLTGTAERITPTITSDPPVSDLTLLSLLGPSTIGLQRTAFNTATVESLQATGRSLLVQSLGGIIGAKILPFADSVRLDVEGATPEPTVTFEKRISNDLRVTVAYNTSNSQNREIIEWQVNPSWVLEFTRDSQLQDTYIINAVDARFRRRYLGQW